LALAHRFDLNGNKGTEVAWVVEIGEIAGRKPLGLWVVLHALDSLLVSWVLGSAIDPDLVLVGLILDDGLEVGGEVVRQVIRFVEVVVNKSVDFIQLEENAGLALRVPVPGRVAISQLGHFEGGVGQLVGRQEVVGPVDPALVSGDLTVLAVLGRGLAVRDHGGCDRVWVLDGSETHPGRLANDAVLRPLPLGHPLGQRGEENGQHGSPEGSQATVVDHIEDENESPGLGGPGENFSSLLVVDQVLDGFPTLPLLGLDGSPSQNHLEQVCVFVLVI